MAQHIPPLWVYRGTSKSNTAWVEVVARNSVEARWLVAEFLLVPMTTVMVLPLRPLGAA